MATILMFLARHGRLILAASLVVGLTSTALANLVQPHIDVFIALLLFTACLRVGPQQVLGVVREIRTNLVFTVVLQMFLPLLIATIAWFFTLQSPLVFAIVLLASAPALSGSPHLVALMGFDPTPALRQLIIGTMLLPITIIPVFFLLPQMANLDVIILASLRLLAVISIAAVLAFAIRLTIMKSPSNLQLKQVDGVSTILLAIVVVGLMAAIQQEMFENPMNVFIVLLVAVGVNFGFQVLASTILARTAYAVPIGIIAGNRNIALFLTALPESAVQPLLLFIACYQIPMYLTPIIMRKYYLKVGRKP